jgi:undecaprenyl-diphosphatase
VATLLLLYAGVWASRFTVGELGPFAPLVGVLLAGLLAAVLGPVLLVHYREPLRAAIVRGATWLRVWLEATGLLQRFAARYPRLARFLAARFARTATGLGLTLGLVAAGAALWVVLELTVEVVFGSRTVAIDHRLLNLVALLRTPALDQVMLVITFLGNAQTIVVLAAVAVIVALVAGRGRDAVLLLLALIASALFFNALKLLVARPRPPLEDARLVQGGFSFPSGHSTLAATFYGTLAYLLIRGLRHEGMKVLVGVGAGLLILAIGVSRIYLGVHYPSDVLAGWAAGALWLALVVAAEQVWPVFWHPGRLGRNARAPVPRTGARTPLSPRRQALTVASALVLLVGASGYLASIYGTIPPPPTSAPVAPEVVGASAVPTTLLTQLPHYTEGLTGHRQEPVSLVFVGTRAQVEGAFQAAGWTEAQPYGFTSLAHAIGRTLTHQSDPAGPVTPSFLAEQPNALAFSQPVGATFAQRHHIRLWSTRVQTSEGQPVWLATASFDRGFELAKTTFLPTHQIAPSIDTERAYVVASLQSTGMITNALTVQLVPPESGHNFDGDLFVTDGKAVILWLG